MTRPQPTRRRANATAILAVAAALLLAASLSAPVWAEIVEEVAAFVNGQIITKSELEEREEQVRAQLARQLNGLDFETKLGEIKRTLLSDLVREVILLQRAEIMGLDLEKIYKQAVDNLKEQQGIKTNDEFKALLEQEGIQEGDLRKILLRYNVPDIMINLEVRQKIVVTPAEVEEYFEKHRDEFRVEESYKFREVVILADSHEPAEVEEIAGRLEADLAAGLPFNEAVLKYSDAPSRFQEGEVGPLKSEDIAPGILAELAKLKEGEASGRIQMRHGLHYVRLEARTSAKEQGIEEVRSGIEQKLKRDRFPAELEAYWKRLYAENRIEVRSIYRVYADDIPRT